MATKITSITERLYPYVLAVGGALGLIAMTWQVAERITMLKNPSLELGCSINPVVDCGGVLGNSLSAVFGFPNALLGMIFFAILATSGLMLLAGGSFVGWYRHVVMGVSVVLMLFSAWFFWVSLYVLGNICVFCVVGWIVSVPIFWYGLLCYLQSAPGRLKARTKRFVAFGQQNHVGVVLAVYLAMLTLFLLRFSDYYFS